MLKRLFIMICSGIFLSLHLLWAASYVPHSVLAKGYWVKVKITKSGIYKITYDDLKEMGLPDPAHPHIFGNGGGMLPEQNGVYHPDDLLELPLWISKGGDGVFNKGDYMLFYATGPVRWQYSPGDSSFYHINPLYDKAAYYFITSSSSAIKEIPLEPFAEETPTDNVTSFDDYLYHETDRENLIKSGREWYEPLPTLSPVTFHFSFPHRLPAAPIRMQIRVVARSSRTSRFDIKTADSDLTSILVGPVNIFSYTSAFAKTGIRKYHFFSSGEDDLPVTISYQSNDQVNARAWLDKIDIQVRRKLILTENEMPFRDIRTVGPGRTTDFFISLDGNTGGIVWDITDIHQVKWVETREENNTLHCRVHTDSLRQFIVFRGSAFPSPEIAEKPLPNQDLHGLPQAELVIVSYPAFMEQAIALGQYHHDHDNMSVAVVSTEQVYNEFSSGARDIAAIRNLMKMFYDRATDKTEKPRYLLLLGDGSYDNLTQDENNSNFIPTYQSPNSLVPTQSYVSDDFFGLLDDEEGGTAGLLDIGVGRFPVGSTKEAEIIVNKIKAYYAEEALGDWRNDLCFVGDDEDNNIHMKDADRLATYVDTTYPSFIIKKIYLDAFQQVSGANGERYPDVNQAISDNIERGLLIFNYVGHGNERGLAHESILGVNDIISWHNFPRCPLFITATCEFSRFDDVDIDANGQITPKTSAGEHVLLAEHGGGIALLTTTRLVYSSPNFILNRNFYKYIFELNDIGKPNTFGDALRYTKNISGSSTNKLNFTLLGDPALRLAYPRYRVITDSVNGKAVTDPPDTLKALSMVTISGHIEDPAGLPLPNTEGMLYPAIFDKSREVTTLGNDEGSPMTFFLRDNIIFRGKAKIEQGTFRFSFLVPKDISYNIGNGKIFYYALLDKQYEGGGSFKDILVGGFSNDPAEDTEGPHIRLYLNDTLFREGGLSDENPVFIAYVSDEGGINTVGNGIGHDITAILDDDESHPIVLNDYFTYETDEYRRGVVRYPFFNLSDGEHTIRFKVWDNYNNSGEAVLHFHVNDGMTEKIENLRNYPNPTNGETWFTFDHNLADQDVDITIYIFDMAGHLIRIVESRQFADGYSIQPIYWNGKSADGQKVSAGIYVYKVIIRSNSDTQVTGEGKLVIVK